MSCSDDDCSICLNPITKNMGKLALSCSHVYHINCITAWFSEIKEQTCPLCRKTSTTSELIKWKTYECNDYELDRMEDINMRLINERKLVFIIIIMLLGFILSILTREVLCDNKVRLPFGINYSCFQRYDQIYDIN